MPSKSLIERAMFVMDSTEWGSDSFDCAAYVAYHAMSPAQKETFHQLLFHGPVYDGHIISKTARDYLINLGLAVRCCVKGEQGYTAAAYRALTVFHAGNPPNTHKNPLSAPSGSVSIIAALKATEHTGEG